MTEVSLSRLHHPVRNLGFGVRAGVWFQGCTLHCRGCVSRDTWEFHDSAGVTAASVLNWVDGLRPHIDGVTISGGEPTDQPDALRALLEGLSSRRGGIDVLVFSGRASAPLRSEFPWLWDGLVDVLVSEPFDERKAGAFALRGSGNQVVHRLTPLARERYPRRDFERDYGPQRKQIGVTVDDGSVWMVGIPQPGDLERARELLEARGVTVGSASWLG